MRVGITFLHRDELPEKEGILVDEITRRHFFDNLENLDNLNYRENPKLDVQLLSTIL